MNTVTHIDEKNFESQVLDSAIPVLVDFSADWCGPCKALAPILEEIAQELGDEIHVAKIDIDANPSIAETYNVQSIPTLILFEGGNPLETLLGLHPKDHIIRTLREKLSATNIVKNT